MLSVGPGKLSVPEALSEELVTSATALLAGLKTNVRSRFGLSTIIPASATVPAREIKKGLEVSFVASTISNAGKIAPVEPKCTGFETNARNLRPLLLCDFVELLPQETSPAVRKMETKRALKVLFNPGTPRTLQDRELDAKSGL